MNNISIKIIFLIFTIAIFIYSNSYAKFEIVQNNNIIGAFGIFLFNLISIIFSNIMFFSL